MSERFRIFKRFDWRLFFAALALTVLGLLAIFSSEQYIALQKQVSALFLGLGIFLVLVLIDYDILKKFAEVFYGIGIFLLILVLNNGHEAMGAQRWLVLLGVKFQPSEFIKLAMIMMLAKMLEVNQKNITSLLRSLPAFIIVGIPFFIVFKQPDLGTALVLIFIFAAALLWADIGLVRLFLLASPLLSIIILHLIPIYPLWTWSVYLLGLVILLILAKINFLDSIIYFGLNVVGGIFSPLLWNNLEVYQQKRLLSFLNPAVDPLARGVRYHMVKAMIAVGSGGFFGKGFHQGPLTQLRYIPQQHTDFVFSIIAEEFGFVGALLVVLLFCYIIYRLVNIALSSRDDFSAILVIGIAAMFLFQFLVNIGMNLGILPVVGIPLPFVSYGGSSLVMFFAALGIVQSVIIRRSHLNF